MSMREARRRLPHEFVSGVYNTFPMPVAERILVGFVRERAVTLRVNSLKTSVREVMALLWQARVKYDRVLWYDDALIVKNKRERDLERLRLYNNGFIYLQSLSSMIPPLVLAPKPGETVLDIAAAPGSKTTQIAALMNGEGKILANELNSVRAERLKHNLVRQGVKNVEIRIGDGKLLGKAMPESFDRVLVDAPCSGEGLFLVNRPATYRHWSSKLVRRLRGVQKALLRSGLMALKPGGVLVYSTCTLGYEENELVLEEVLSDWGDEVAVKPVHLQTKDFLPALSRISTRELRPDLSNAIRVLPSEKMEGFFIAKLVKRN